MSECARGEKTQKKRTTVKRSKFPPEMEEGERGRGGCTTCAAPGEGEVSLENEDLECVPRPSGDEKGGKRGGGKGSFFTPAPRRKKTTNKSKY